MQFEITSKAGLEMGVFSGVSPEQALVKMFVDAGYNAYVDDGNVAFDDAESARLCGGVDDWYIEEVADD